MWFASCPQCALEVATTKDASVVHVANFSSSAGCREDRWVHRVALFIPVVSHPVVRIFNLSIGGLLSMIHVRPLFKIIYIQSNIIQLITNSYFMLNRLRKKRSKNQPNRWRIRRFLWTIPLAGN